MSIFESYENAKKKVDDLDRVGIEDVVPATGGEGGCAVMLKNTIVYVLSLLVILPVTYAVWYLVIMPYLNSLF